MTRAPQIEQQPDQQQAAAPATERSEESFGLPRPLYAQIMQLTPDDAESLSSLLRTYPGFSKAILQVAAGHMGNAAVQRAIASNGRSAAGPGEQPGHHPLSQAELHEFLDDSPAKAAPATARPNQHPLSQAELHEFLDDPPAKAQPAQGQPNQHPLSQAELHEFLDDPPVKAQPARPAGPKTATQADSPRMAAARAFNHQHSHLVEEFNGLTNYMCIDMHGGGDEVDDGRKLDPQLVASWQQQHGLQADGMVGPLTVAAARQPRASGPEAEESAAVGHTTENAHAVVEEAEWKPSTDKTETALAGTYGEYRVKHGFTDDPTDGWEYEVKITMTANDKATAEKIGWVQVVRRSKGGAGGWATGKDDQGMTEERAKRTDAKTGFRVDRVSAPEKKTPFYGMSKGSDGNLTAASTTVIGKHGGANPYLYDTPGLYDKDELEFVSTATDMSTGAQYDAVRWGCKYDKDGKVATEITPALVKASDDVVAGRDRAINKWNTDVAGGDIDKVPTTADPAATAKTLSGQLSTAKVDEPGVASALKSVTDADLRKRIQACYKLETGRTLVDDLKAHMSKDALTGLDAWL